MIDKILEDMIKESKDKSPEGKSVIIKASTPIKRKIITTEKEADKGLENILENILGGEKVDSEDIKKISHEKNEEDQDNGRNLDKRNFLDKYDDTTLEKIFNMLREWKMSKGE